jgi:hypothetical protein
MSGGILALDLASTTGWAYGTQACAAPEVGTWRLGKGSEVARMGAFGSELSDFVRAHRPSVILLEAPISFRVMRRFADAAQQLGLRAVAMAIAWQNETPCHEIECLRVRAEMLGSRNFPRGEVKGVVMAYWQRRGVPMPDHNAADAALMWEWYRLRLTGKPPPLVLAPVRLSPGLSMRRSRASIVRESDIRRIHA